MYFGLIYDKKFIKNDRDFYGDAIIYFHPQESKEKVNHIYNNAILAVMSFFSFD